MERISIYCIILSVFSVPILHAQSAVLATGLDASAANGFVSYSVGQMTYLEKGTGQVLEGVQQPYEIITLEKNHCILNSLGNLLQKNFFDSFVRIHRSYAVPRHLIRGKSCHEIELAHHIKLPIGRTYKDNLSFFHP